MQKLQFSTVGTLMFVAILFVGCGNQPQAVYSTSENVENQSNTTKDMKADVETASISTNSVQVLEDKKETPVAVEVKVPDTKAPEKMNQPNSVNADKKINSKPTEPKTETIRTTIKPAIKEAEAEKMPVNSAPTVVTDVESQVVSKVEENVLVEEKPVKIVAAKPDHSAWNNLLQKHVSSSGAVNYAGIIAEKSKLEAYCSDLSANPITSDWSRNEKMAYWINAYNAFTVKLIVDNYPVAKITDLEGGKPWDKKWIKLGAKTYSLNQIENDILRPVYKEPRIHFAVNCAAKSCPPLLNQAWTADNLERNFAKQTKAFINDSNYNKISGNSAQLSKIFDWYAEDFGDLKRFINKYAGTKVAAETEIKFAEYDWNLNKKKSYNY